MGKCVACCVGKCDDFLRCTCTCKESTMLLFLEDIRQLHCRVTALFGLAFSGDLSAEVGVADRSRPLFFGRWPRAMSVWPARTTLAGMLLLVPSSLKRVLLLAEWTLPSTNWPWQEMTQTMYMTCNIELHRNGVNSVAITFEAGYLILPASSVIPVLFGPVNSTKYVSSPSACLQFKNQFS